MCTLVSCTQLYRFICQKKVCWMKQNIIFCVLSVWTVLLKLQIKLLHFSFRPQTFRSTEGQNQKCIIGVEVFGKREATALFSVFSSHVAPISGGKKINFYCIDSQVTVFAEWWITHLKAVHTKSDAMKHGGAKCFKNIFFTKMLISLKIHTVHWGPVGTETRTCDLWVTSSTL